MKSISKATLHAMQQYSSAAIKKTHKHNNTLLTTNKTNAELSDSAFLCLKH